MNVFRRDSLRAFGSRFRRKADGPPLAVIEEIISRAIMENLKPPHNYNQPSPS